MALSYGFFDSSNGDRTYSATQFSSIFDGIINDGIYSTIGERFWVTPGSGLSVSVGTGRAWLKRKWVYNSSAYTVNLETADSSHPRIDAIVLEVNTNSNKRNASIKVIKGTAAASPSRPSIDSGDSNVGRMPLAYVRINAGASAPSNITNVVGTTETPFVTGILEVKDAGEWIDDMNRMKNNYENRVIDIYDEFRNYLNSLTTNLQTSGNDVINEFRYWMENKKSVFDDWLSRLQNELSSNQAANLAARIEEVDIEAKQRIKLVSVDITLPAPADLEPGAVDTWDHFNITQYIPNYYTAKAVFWQRANNYSYFIAPALELADSGASINLRVKNISNTTKTLSSIKLMFICTHN